MLFCCCVVGFVFSSENKYSTTSMHSIRDQGQYFSWRSELWSRQATFYTFLYWSKFAFKKLWPGLATSWWRHQMETFSASLAFCVGKSPVTGEFPSQRPVTRSFDVFFDLCLSKWLTKQLWGWWFETPSQLWCHCNVLKTEDMSVFNL